MNASIGVVPLNELRTLLARHARPDLRTPIEDVLIFKAERPYPPTPATYGKVLAIIAQGTKRCGLGDRVFEYRAGQYLVTSVDLPVTGYFTKASPELPGLGVGLTLDPATVAEVLLSAAPGDLPQVGSGTPPGIAVSTASAELLDAVTRLMRLLDQPRDITVLAPLIKREILWRLLTSDQGAIVRQLGLPDSSLSHIARAVRWIRDHNPTLPGRRRGTVSPDERLRLLPHLPRGDRDEPDSVPETDPPPAGPTRNRHRPQRHRRRQPPRRLRQPIAIQPRIPSPVRLTTSQDATRLAPPTHIATSTMPMVEQGRAQPPGRVLRGVRPTSEDHRATTFELFFDLVYVFAITQVTGYIADEHSAYGVLQGLLLLTLLWGTWSSYAWLGNQARADEDLLRAGMVVAMATMFVIALTIPEAWRDAPGGLNGPLVLVCAYLLVRCVHLTVYAAVAIGDPGLRHQVAITWLPTIAGAAFLVAGALLGGWNRRCCSPLPSWWNGSAPISPPGMAIGGCTARCI